MTSTPMAANALSYPSSENRAFFAMASSTSATLGDGLAAASAPPCVSQHQTRLAMRAVVRVGGGGSSGPWSLSLNSNVSQVRGRIRAAAAATPDSAAKSDDYNQAMQSKMRNPYEYHHDLGMNFTHIEKNLIVGSQPQTREDIDRLYNEEGVRAVLNLQQDKDVEYWGIDLPSIIEQCNAHEISYMRIPARDFDPQSLRHELPRAVAALEGAISKGSSVYVHCTAGLGRSPAVAIAYLFWFLDMDMETAYTLLTSKRPCGPKKEAIRGATYDLAKTDPGKPPLEELPENAFTDISARERELIQERVRKLR